VFKGRESEIIAHGELVAAMSPEDKCWYRAVLKDYDDNTNSVLVSTLKSLLHYYLYHHFRLHLLILVTLHGLKRPTYVVFTQSSYTYPFKQWNAHLMG